MLGVWVYDYDNYITKERALALLTGMFAGLAGLGYLAKQFNSPARNPAVRSFNFFYCVYLQALLDLQGPREFPFNNLEEARGGYPLPTKE